MINVNIYLHGFSSFVCTCFVPNWGSPGALGWLNWTARGRLPSDSPQEYWWLPWPQYPRKKWMKQLNRKSVVITSRDYLMLVNRIFHRDCNWSRRVTFSSVNATWKFYQSKSEIKILLLTGLMVDKECNTAEKKNRLTVDIRQSWEKFSQIISTCSQDFAGCLGRKQCHRNAFEGDHVEMLNFAICNKENKSYFWIVLKTLILKSDHSNRYLWKV